jgi:predicted short-subunit dehydrogenase-like oxidoreductase (DUF2520 family)
MKQSLNYKMIALMGAGAVGKALAEALLKAGFTLSTILDRSPGAARSLAQSLGVPRFGSEVVLIGKDRTLLFIAVPDDEILSVDQSLAKHLSQLDLIGAVHTSGALPGAELQRLSAAGVPVGSLHPLQTFPQSGQSPTLKGIYFAFEGDVSLRPILIELVKMLGGIPVNLPSEGKSLYHASAVFASNFIPILLREARQLLTAAEIPDEMVRPMLAPLMRTTLENCLQSGEVKALTGPVARGDAATIRRHLQVLQEISPGTQALYRMLSLRALELAVEKGLANEAIDQIHKELAG